MKYDEILEEKGQASLPDDLQTAACSASHRTNHPARRVRAQGPKSRASCFSRCFSRCFKSLLQVDLDQKLMAVKCLHSE